MLSVPYAEAGTRDGTSPRVAINRDGNHVVTRKIRVKDSDAETACKQAVGWARPEAVEGLPVIRRELPELYPRNSFFSCKSAAIVARETWTGRTVYEPWQMLTNFVPNPILSGKIRTKNDDNLDPPDALPKVNTYRHAVIELTYEMQEYDIRTDEYIATFRDNNEFYRFMTRRKDRAVKYLTVNAGSMFYVKEGDEGSRTIPFSLGKLEVENTLYYKQWGIPNLAVPWKTIEGTQGKVNKDRFDGYEPGTLLYLPPRAEYFMNADSFRALNLEHVILHVPQLHNRILYAVQSDPPLRYHYFTPDASITTDPDPAALPDGKFLYDAVEFWKVFCPRFG